MESLSPPFRSGRVQFVDGERYYSPNSLVDPPLLLNPLEEGLENIFLPQRRGLNDRVRYRDYVHPRPWSPKYGWVPFIPVNPSQWFDHSSYIGRALSKYPPLEHLADQEKKSHGWIIARGNEWAQLEDDLYNSIRTLSHTYKIPCSLPFLPNAIGYQEMYAHKRTLITRLDVAREWFFVFFGALSHLIAVLRLRPWDFKTEVSSDLWLSALHSAGVSPKFVDGIHDSLVQEVHQDRVRRSGVVIDLLSPPKGQPSAEWFAIMGVPVWYRWGSAEAESPSLHKWRPPNHLLREGLHARLQATASSPPNPKSLPNQGDSLHNSPDLETFIQPSPTGPLPAPDRDEPHQPSSPPRKYPESSCHPKEVPEWVEFFKDREAAHERLLVNETPQARQARENRTRERATSSAKVFEWWKSDKEGVSWERIPVLAKARSETLDDYSDTQKRYDPFFNEWDCCGEWGEDNLEDWADDGLYADCPPIPPSDASSLVRISKEPPSVPFSHAEADPPMDNFLQYPSGPPNIHLIETHEHLVNFFGFCYSASGAEPPQPTSRRDRVFFLRVIGADVQLTPDDPYFFSTHFYAAQAFVKSLSTRQTPLTGTWDVSDDCVQPVSLTPRFHAVRQVRLRDEDKVDPHDTVTCYYIFDCDGSDQTGSAASSWRIGVTSAAAAMAVCRRPKVANLSDIAFFLAGMGVPFRAFHPSDLLVKGPPLAVQRAYKVPKRPFGHRFTKEDYDAYVLMRTLLLSQPHMQAAVKRGGIVWRLAVGTLGTSRACMPPPPWGATHTATLSGILYVDSALTTVEMDLICGAYECVSADGKQRALKSWWPLARYYEKEECGENYGRWTPRREAWYVKRLDAIESGIEVPQPLTYTEWKSSQHGPASIRTLHAYAERISSQLLESHPSQ